MRERRHRRRRVRAVRSAYYYIGSLFVCVCAAAVMLAYPPVKEVEPAVAEATPIRYVSSVETTKQVLILPTAVRLAKTETQEDLRGDEPTVLIYHTHTTEAYTQTAENPYAETGSWRTSDKDKSVVAVGEALAERLRREYGYCVIHDTTNHEPPSLSTAYERSEKTMLLYREKYPTLRLYIDIHRDAYTVTDEPTKDYAVPYGDETCRIMCVVGEGLTSEVKPYYRENLALASRLTERLNQMDERLARPVRVKPGRYNQHISKGCLLIEVGHNANTLEQAMAVVPYLADALALSVSDVQSAESVLPDLSVWVPDTFDKP